MAAGARGGVDAGPGVEPDGRELAADPGAGVARGGRQADVAEGRAAAEGVVADEHQLTAAARLEGQVRLVVVAGVIGDPGAGEVGGAVGLGLEQLGLGELGGADLLAPYGPPGVARPGQDVALGLHRAGGGGRELPGRGQVVAGREPALAEVDPGAVGEQDVAGRILVRAEDPASVRRLLEHPGAAAAAEVPDGVVVAAGAGEVDEPPHHPVDGRDLGVGEGDVDGAGARRRRHRDEGPERGDGMGRGGDSEDHGGGEGEHERQRAASRHGSPFRVARGLSAEPTPRSGARPSWSPGRRRSSRGPGLWRRTASRGPTASPGARPA